MRQLSVALVAALLAIQARSAFADECNPSDIRILQADIRREGAFVHGIGEIRNDCKEATGVQLQVVFRAHDGKVVLPDNFWPDSTNNIPAGATIAFDTMDIDPGGIASIDVRVLSVKAWRR